MAKDVMENMKFSYVSEKLSAARSILMAPHPRGEDESFAGAFHECMLGLDDLEEKGLDDLSASARKRFDTIRRAMDTEGVEDPTGTGEQGLWFYKARSMSLDEKFGFSKAVDELADYCDLRFWGIE